MEPIDEVGDRTSADANTGVDPTGVRNALSDRIGGARVPVSIRFAEITLSSAEIVELLDAYAEAGVCNILALGGDPPTERHVALGLLRVPTGEAGGVRTHLEPALPEVTIDNQLTVLPAAKSCPWPNVVYSVRDDGKRATITLTGSLHQGCSAERYLSALDAPVYTASLIRTLWNEMGGRIHGGNRIGPAPSNARLLARNTSPDLMDVVRDINKYSNNTMARQLFLTIGREQRSAVDADDHKAANRIINQWLADKGIQPSGLVLENGSGLSRMERMSARDMAQLLSQAWQSPYAAEFVASMPLAAMDGTMRRRLRNTPVAGQAHIKTGSLRNVRAIAGITRDNNGQSWAVTAIVNHPAAGGARQALDIVLPDVYRRGPTDVAGSR